MEQAQAACRKLRASAHPNRSPKADAIEAEWRADPAYEGDYAWLTRMQAGAHRP